MDFEDEGAHGEGDPDDRFQDSDGDEHEKPSKKDLLMGRRKDKKDSKKDRGYAALAGESSPDEDADTKSPSKMKKSKAFKFPSKSKEKREKSRDKDKLNDKESKEKESAEKKKEKLKKEKKEKEKEEKSKLKETKEKCKDKEKDKSKEKDKEKKDKKVNKQQPTIAAGIPFEEIFTIGVAQPVFGVSLCVAVDRSRCHDGSNLPLCVRHCIDYLQEYGLESEVIYRTEAPKQKVLVLRKKYNDRETVQYTDYDLPTACALLKLFIMELPEPILTTELNLQFEESINKGISKYSQLISKLPPCNYAIVSWIIHHLHQVAANEKVNHLTSQMIGPLLGPVFNMSTDLLILLINNASILFPNVQLKKYIPPLTSSAPRLPETSSEIIEELQKQESLLNLIHAEMHAGFITPNREEQLWEGQRIVTQLKRKLRTVQKLCDQGQTQSIEEKPQTVSEPEQIPCKDNNKKQLKESDETTNTLQATEKNAQEKCKQNISKDTFAVSKKNSLSVETFEDNFDEEPLKQSNAMTDSIISTNSDISKVEKPSLSKEELQLMQLQLEHTEYLQLKSILQAKINSQKFDIVKLRSHMAIKSKQDSNLQKESDGLHSYTDLENEERYRLFKENALLEKKRLSLVGQIFQERIACIQLRIQLAMNEIM